jgi:phage I-like protein
MSVSTKTYVLTGARYTRITGKGDDQVIERFRKGDLVELSDSEYERLQKAFELPGESQRKRAEALRAEAERLNAEADAITGQAEEHDAAVDRVESGKPAVDDDLDSLTKKERQGRVNELGLQVTGTGKDGNVTSDDLLKALREHAASSPQE